MERELGRHLYRALLRTARQVDERPIAKALITRPPASVYDFAAEEWTRATKEPREPRLVTRADEAQALVNRMTTDFLRGAVYYRPSACMLDQVRSEFRIQPTSEKDAQIRLDAAFAVLKLLSEASAISEQTPPSKRPRSYTANTQTPTCSSFGLSLAKETLNGRSTKVPKMKANLQDGSVLIAHPLLDGFFSRSIVLITSYDEQFGAQGLILNSRRIGFISSSRLFGIPRSHACQGEERVARLPVYDGGPVRNGYTVLSGGHRSLSIVNVVHPYGHLPGATKIGEGAFLNFDPKPAANEFVKGRLNPDKLLVYGDSAGWGKGQLEGELAQNAWYLAQHSETLGHLISEISTRQRKRHRNEEDQVDLAEKIEFEHTLDNALGHGDTAMNQTKSNTSEPSPSSLASEPVFVGSSHETNDGDAEEIARDSSFINEIIESVKEDSEDIIDILVTDGPRESRDQDRSDDAVFAPADGGDADSGKSDSWQSVLQLLDNPRQDINGSDAGVPQNDQSSWGEIVRSFGGEYQDLARMPSRGA